MTNEYIDRVTFFSVNDLSSSHNLLNAEKILKEQKQIDSSNINDILEIFHIKKFFDEQFYHPSWSANDIKEFTLTLKNDLRRKTCNPTGQMQVPWTLSQGNSPQSHFCLHCTPNVPFWQRSSHFSP